MDQQLTGLLVQFWATGDHDSARVLADRFQELSAEQVAQALMKFWGRARSVQALGEVDEAINVTGTVAACRAFAEALCRLPPEEIARALQALPQTEDANFPP